MVNVFYVDVLHTSPGGSPDGSGQLVYPKCNMAVVLKGEHDKVQARANELPVIRNALGNLVAALMRKQPPMVDQPDIEFALREARKALGFPFDARAEHE